MEIIAGADILWIAADASYARSYIAVIAGLAVIDIAIFKAVCGTALIHAVGCLVIAPCSTFALVDV